MKPHRSAWLLSLLLVGFVLIVLLAKFFTDARPLHVMQEIDASNEKPQRVETQPEIEIIKLAVIDLPETQAKKSASVEPLPSSVAAPLHEPVSSEAGGKAQADGGPVSIIGEFDCEKGFYLKAMRKQGALLVLYDSHQRHYFELFPDGTSRVLQSLPSHFSRAARRLTQDYPDAQQVIARQKQLWGRSSLEILMLWPVSLETKVENFIRLALSGSGIKGRPEKAWVRYRQQGDQLVIDLEQVLTAVGKVPLHQSLVL